MNTRHHTILADLKPGTRFYFMLDDGTHGDVQHVRTDMESGCTIATVNLTFGYVSLTDGETEVIPCATRTPDSAEEMRRSIL
jgi:hypothetical protein